MDRHTRSVSRVVRHLDTALETATRRFAEGAPASEAILAVNDVLENTIELPLPIFFSLSPQSMVSVLEITSSDDLVIAKVAEALLLQAHMLQAEGQVNEAGAKREQAAAVLEFIDPTRAN